jgi:hypothetical protein
MPDIHWGYGFPIGGVAAFDPDDGVISPGGVGYDINCGVRLLALPLDAAELGARREALVHEISRAVPAGAGRRPAELATVPSLTPFSATGHAASAATTTSRAPSPGAAYPAPILPPSPNERASGVPGNSGRWAPATTSLRSRESSMRTRRGSMGCTSTK